MRWPEGRPQGLPVIPPDIEEDVNRTGKKIIDRWGTIRGGEQRD